MEYLYEKDLKKSFWDKNYKFKKNIKRYQFECSFREGNIDLVTLETVKDDYQICAFEFKLKDIKRALAQAEANIPFVHKSFVVVPIERKSIILDKYLDWLHKQKYIGVIGVDINGRWEMVYKPQINKNIQISAPLIKFLINDV